MTYDTTANKADRCFLLLTEPVRKSATTTNMLKSLCKILRKQVENHKVHLRWSESGFPIDGGH